MTFYIDANVFIFATLGDDIRAVKAKEILKKVVLGEIRAITSSLTIDEVVWNISKQTKDRNLAIEQGLRILQFDNLDAVSVDAKIIQSALGLMEKYNLLKPRDAIHLAVALAHDVSVIVTDDSDFDAIKEIKTKHLD